MDHFIQKTNKYAIKGYPYKFGLLLHGPPDTGKTSLIKAIAEYTKRNIVNINLAAIKTNQELKNIIFNHQYFVQDELFPLKMGFRDVVEDIDAASSVVKKREGETEIDDIDIKNKKKMLSVLENIKFVNEPSVCNSPLFCALLNNHIELALNLINNYNANINDVSTTGSSVIHIACKNGFKTIIEALFEKGDIDINVLDENGMSCLALASENGFNEIVDMLFQKGVAINETNRIELLKKKTEKKVLIESISKLASKEKRKNKE